MTTTKNALTNPIRAAALAALISLAAACVPDFNALPMAADAGKRIKQAAAEASQVDGAKAKAAVFANAYCELRAKYPAAIEKIRLQLQAAVPAIAIAAAKAMIDNGCGGLMEGDSKPAAGSQP